MTIQEDNPSGINQPDPGSIIRSEPRLSLEGGELRVAFFSLAHLLERYAKNINKGGIFIETYETLPPGTRFHIVMELGEDNQSIDGFAEVAWVKKLPDNEGPAGMGLKFLYLDEEGQSVVDTIVEAQRRIQEHRTGTPTDSDALSEADDQMRVLVAHDNSFIRSWIGRGLVEAGIKVDFHDSAELAAKVLNFGPDFLLVNVSVGSMAGVDGLAFLRDKAGNDVTILIFASLREDKLAQMADDLGADGYIKKPHDPGEIADMIKAFQEQRRLAAGK